MVFLCSTKYAAASKPASLILSLDTAMKTMLKNYSLGLVILLLQILLTFGLYIAWSTESALQQNPTSKALEQNIALKIQQISDSHIRSLLEQQQTVLQSRHSERNNINGLIQKLMFLSAGVVILLLLGIVGKQWGQTP